MKAIEKLTYATIMFNTKHSNCSDSTGTGFFVHMCHNKTLGISRVVLVTNKHVVKDSYETKITFCTKDKQGNANDQSVFTKTLANISWVMHPNPNVDLCCYDMTNTIQGLSFLSRVSKERENINIIPDIHYHAISMDMIPIDDEVATWDSMEDLIMIGYPNGIKDDYNNKPVIRRGISAVHMKNDYMGQSEILIDMACYPGSSGSPVFALIDKSNVVNNSVTWGKQLFFVGILHAGPQHLVVGEIHGNPQINTVAKIPNNLGFVAKSKELKVLEDILYEQNLALKKQ